MPALPTGPAEGGRAKRQQMLAIGRGWSTIPAVMASMKARKRAGGGQKARRIALRKTEKLPKDAATLLVILGVFLISWEKMT